MKKNLFILINFLGLSFTIFAQSPGDYRSIANGNWNDATKWERYNGSSWVGANSYPGEQPGTGLVTISTQTEIKITETVPFPVSSIFDTTILTGEWPNPSGQLTFSAESAVSLTVSGDMNIYGSLGVENRTGAKLHSLFIGGNLTAGLFDYNQSEVIGGYFESADGDDKLHLIFNSEDPVIVTSLTGLLLHDVTFDCAGITMLETYIAINGNAAFNRGIITEDYYGNYFRFNDGSTVSGASSVSYVDGWVTKVGNDPFTFPIGDNNKYGPLTISAPSGEWAVYYAQYISANAEALGPIRDTGLYSVSNCEYWNFSANTGTPINVTVGWTETSGCGSSPYISNVSEVTLAANTNGWATHGGSGTGTTTNGSVTWYGVTFSSTFTLGNLKPGCVAPYDYYTYAVSTSSATLKWGNSTGAINYDVDYKVQGSNIWINLATATVSNVLTISNLATGNYDWRLRSNCSSLSSAYVQSSFTIAPTNPPPAVCKDVYEINNTSRQARLIHDGNAIIYSGITTPTDIDWFKLTTPDNSYTNLVVTLSNLYADYDLYVYDQRNKLIGSSTKFGTSNEVVTYNLIARKATYYIMIMGKNGAFNASYCYSLQALISSNLLSSSSINNAPQIELMDDKVISQMGLMNDVDRQMLYPNPATGFVNFSFNSTVEGMANVQIVNSVGIILKQSTVRVTKGFNLVKIPVNDIVPGMYLLRMNKGEMNITKRFMKAK